MAGRLGDKVAAAFYDNEAIKPELVFWPIRLVSIHPLAFN